MRRNDLTTCAEDELADDVAKHGEVPDTHDALQPFVWPQGR